MTLRRCAPRCAGTRTSCVNAYCGARSLASDLRPRMLKEMARTIAFGELPAAFGAFVAGQARGRVVVDLNA